MAGRDNFERNKLVITFFVGLFALVPRIFRILIWDLSRSFSQLPFIGLRYVILKSLGMNIGDNVRIGTNVSILHWGNLSVGDNVSIHDNCYIDCFGGVSIGTDVSIAHATSILSSNHQWSDPNLPIKYNAVSLGGVIIEDDVWVGCGCRILAGVRIESRSVVAAGAVVNRDVARGCVVGGVPAKVISSTTD